MTRLLLLSASIVLPPALVVANDSPDLEVVSRINQEAYEYSQVTEHLFQFVDGYGPRFTNSSGFMGSAKWAVEQLQSCGLVNAELDGWGRE